MKKNITKLIAALLCATLLCFAFASCGNGGKKNTDDAATGSSQPAEENGIWLPFIENK